MRDGSVDPFVDLFAAVRADDSPVVPDPEYSSRLRRRVETAVRLPRGVTPVTTTTANPIAGARPRGAAIPYLAVRDARGAIAWYVEVLGADTVGEPIVMPDGRIGHAELALAGGTVYLADEHPEIGVVAPSDGASVSLMLEVGDADDVRSRAIAAGARGDRDPYDAYGTRNAWIVDPFGHRWGLQSPLPVGPYRHGDIAYVSLWTADPDRTARFYRSVLGWQIEGRRVAGQVPPVGLWESGNDPTLFCCYAVEDLESARERVVAAGGSAGPVEHEPHGMVADCVDNQGTPFALWQLGPSRAGTERGLAYLTFEMVRSAPARQFYGAVLGWSFHAGRIEDGWQVDDATPMVGFSGGHDRTVVVPMWQVSDIDAAVRRVRAAGGTASDPAAQPYGRTSECVDDQGMRFYLGEL